MLLLCVALLDCFGCLLLVCFLLWDCFDVSVLYLFLLSLFCLPIALVVL